MNAKAAIFTKDHGTSSFLRCNEWHHVGFQVCEWHGSALLETMRLRASFLKPFRLLCYFDQWKGCSWVIFVNFLSKCWDLGNCGCGIYSISQQGLPTRSASNLYEFPLVIFDLLLETEIYFRIFSFEALHTSLTLFITSCLESLCN